MAKKVVQHHCPTCGRVVHLEKIQERPGWVRAMCVCNSIGPVLEGLETAFEQPAGKVEDADRSARGVEE